MLKQRFLVQFGSSLIVQAVGMIAGIVVARVAGPGIVGIVAYGAAYVSVLAFIPGLFSTAHIKLASEGMDHTECMTVFSRLQGISALLYLGVMGGWFLLQKYVLHYPFESRDVQIVIVLALFAHFFSLYESFSSVVFTANLKQAKANIPHLLRNLAWHLGRVLIVLLGFRAVTLASWNLLLSLLFIPMIYKLLKEYPVGRYNPALAKAYFRYTPPILIGAVVASITRYSDKLLLAHYSNTTELGYYSAAHAIGGIFILIAVPVGNIFFPLFSSLISKGDWEGVNNNIRRYHEFIIIFVLPLICGLAIAGGPPLLLVLGQRYEPSITPFIVLIFSTYVVLMGLPYGNIIAGMGKFYQIAWMDLVKLGIFFVSIMLFIAPRFLNLGAMGLACNQLVISLTTNAMYLFYARKRGKVHLAALNTVRNLVIIFISLLAYWLSGFVKGWSHIWWLFYFPAYLGATYATLIATGLVKKEHWLMLWDALNFRKTVNYINDEMQS